MGEGPLQDLLLFYLVQVLGWLYRTEDWYVARNLDLHYTDDVNQHPLTPNIAVFKGITTREWLQTGRRSWRIYPPLSPAPNVVFEIASDETWAKDIREKPHKYAKWGIPEYFYYDPRPTARVGHMRLRGWRKNGGVPEEMQLNERGWLWSEELESWLVPDGYMLRLFDRIEQQRPTAEEAERFAKEEMQAAKEEVQAAREVERTAREEEHAAKEAERTAKEQAWAYLRRLGFDPESLGDD